jgi:xanthine dehydrogenase accessory factor
MTDWVAELEALHDAGEPAVIVTVGAIRGSAPREPGAKMIVTRRETIGTIGGGQLEYQCARKATELLAGGSLDLPAIQTRRFALGSGCGQCCGGVVDVWFERIEESSWLADLFAHHREREPLVVATSDSGEPGKMVLTTNAVPTNCPPGLLADARRLLDSEDGAMMSGAYLLEPLRPVDFHIAVFGAGHVGTAVVDVLSRLDCDIRWVDGRRGMLPGSLPRNVIALDSPAPAREVAAMPPGSYYLVMTHSHPLDLDICDQVLRRDDAAYCGLIGSRTKRRRFERLLQKQGLDAERLRKLTCPIGVPGIDGKRPAEIALAVAAELLQVKGSRAAAGRQTFGMTA